ncbi:polysaccharide pyruvyl transferase family protein [Sulfitobacter sabulilitoris]|nr:polysaccharide pyruvyl transferase family protein [Sulfitobacter sabulilitoris]
MRVALLGQFGSGNYGNDGSLTAMVASLRRLVPEAELLCICSGPTEVRRRLGVPSVSIGAPAFVSARARALDRYAFRIPNRIRGLLAALSACRGVDAVIVPGTGILDDFHDRASGWPFVLLRWCIAARLAGARIAFISVGAGPIRGRLSRRYLTWAAALAHHRTYRDEGSRDFMVSVGLDASHDLIFPDLALGLSPPPRSLVKVAQTTVAVGLISYFGWVKDGTDSEAIFEAYLEKMVAFVEWLRCQGCHVHLLGGDDSDARAVTALLDRIDGDQALRGSGAVTIGTGRSLEGVMEELTHCDMVVASRFHNVLCALRVRRPTLSIGYAEKNRALLTAAGLGPFCLDIDSLDLETLKSRFLALRSEKCNLIPRIDEFLTEAERQLAQQDASLLRFLKDA